MTRIWWVNVFGGEDAGGNPACVVAEPSPMSITQRQHLTRALRVPDTVFLPADIRAGMPVPLAFHAPAEGPMAFCGHGLLAADRVLRSLGVFQSTDVISFVTPAGTVVTRNDDTDPGVVWFVAQRQALRVVNEDLRLARSAARVFWPRADGDLQAVLIDSGRARLFIPVSPRELTAARPMPDAIMALCREHAVSGICLFAREHARQVRLRVFTVSRNGDEDNATGGAALGLAILVPSGVWGIAQGIEDYFRRGTLLLDTTARDGRIAVGGMAEIVAEGRPAAVIPSSVEGSHR
ncbi:MAG: PhzF family phenazine biosynthesis protein [Pseudomonadales bacterium]|nr:PhzF family phenazine biosynthesis protein [Pseudomonadales bacterium]MCP5185163.1 PhzF family phenazine biosynthesis protein [Pseudomonadales bacterium]